jgi:signal transduction histidine kinase
VLAWAATAVPLTLAGLVGAPGVALSPETLPVLPWTAVVAAVGDGLRSRRAYLAAVEERAERAERSRDEEAGRRVAEERVRIARELHDVVAHHIAVVSVQAGVAQHLLTTAPAAASDALAHVRRSAAAVLEELGDILSVLREPGERGEPGERSEPGGPSAPAPGLARLDTLVDSFIAAGLAVEWSLQGQPRELAPTVDLVAYRVLEEGLTNALKHGTGTAYVRVEYGSSSLHLRVRNSIAVPVLAGSHQGADGSTATTTGSGTGHGLLGMRERAAAVGGTLRAAPAPGGTFCVEADLPLRVSAQP